MRLDVFCSGYMKVVFLIMTQEQPLTVVVIIGSTRPGRRGEMIASWFAEHARTRRDILVEVVDLAEYQFGNDPRAKTPDVEAFAARIEAADGFVVVTPEFNHGYPAPLKAAIDTLFEEWMAKPVGFVSYGGASGGIRAVEQLRQVFAEFHMVTVRDGVTFHRVRTQFDEHGRPVDSERAHATANTMLDRLVWWGRALRTARKENPYKR